MVISKAWYVRCDNCGDPGEISTESSRAARNLAGRRYRWSRRYVDGQQADLCPLCRDVTTLDGTRTNEFDYGLNLYPEEFLGAKP